MSEEFVDKPLPEVISFDRAAATFLDPSRIVFNILWVIIPLILAAFIMFAYIPAMSSLGISKSRLQREHRTKRFSLPIYGHTIPINGSHIRITRKLSSLRGLLLHEMNFTLYLPSDSPDQKRIFDFLVGEKFKKKDEHVLLQKTVEIRNIPLLVVRMRALLATSTISTTP